jgi:hypothetical protein
MANPNTNSGFFAARLKLHPPQIDSALGHPLGNDVKKSDVIVNLLI